MGRRKRRNYTVYSADFETTVYDGQTSTEVWASALVQLNTEDVIIHNSIEETYNFLLNMNNDILLYYHNLKFDGEFWLSYLINKVKLPQAYKVLNESGTDVEWYEQDEMPNNSFKYTISDMGQWYEIVLRVKNHYIVMRDSYKLLPFSVKAIGKAFQTKHQKLDMEYKGYRYAGCDITAEEKEYIANDVLVVKEALEIMFEQGHNKMTIGACCLDEFKKGYDRNDYPALFPDLEKIEIDETEYGSPNVDSYVRKSYFGGWCMVVQGKENQLKYNGTTADVNSLYPSMMHSMSGNKYPVGKPKFWKGNIPYDLWEDWIEKPYFFVRFRCRFYLKKDKLPFVHIRFSPYYKATENLITSDFKDFKTGMYNRYRKNKYTGEIIDSVVELTMTCVDWKLFNEHYIIEDLEILDGCYFKVVDSLFDNYINKYKKIKQESKGAMRTLAKLFLNNLYGKMASSKNSTFRVACENPKNPNTIAFFTVQANDKQVGYIPIGSAITSYARNFTIRTAQANYYGKDRPGFIYADTDSIHCDLQPEELKGLTVHDTEFCCWKLESCWDVGIFARQKTYIEHVTMEDLKPIENPYYNVKCAGMPEYCKQLFIKSFDDITEEELKTYNKEEQEFLSVKRDITDFKKGLKVPGKLLPIHIDGGIVLCETTYEMR